MYHLCFYAFIYFLSSVSLVWKRCWFEKNSSRKMKKFRQNFFESIQSDWAKKNESIAKYSLGRLQKKTSFANKAVSFFSEEIQIYLRLIFSWEDPHVKSFFDTKVEANFHQNLQYDTYQSDIHTSLALLGFCLKPIVPK